MLELHMENVISIYHTMTKEQKNKFYKEFKTKISDLSDMSYTIDFYIDDALWQDVLETNKDYNELNISFDVKDIINDDEDILESIAKDLNNYIYVTMLQPLRLIFPENDFDIVTYAARVVEIDINNKWKELKYIDNIKW